MFRTIGFLVWSASMAVQTSTAIEDGPLRISWSAPSDCPSALDVLVRVRTLLIRETKTVLQHPLDVVARVAQLEDGRYQLDLEMREGSDIGARRIEAATCSELAQAGSLVVALTIDPELLERAKAATLAEGAATPSSSAFAPPPPAPVARAASERSPSNEPHVERGEEPRASTRSFRFGPGLRVLGDAGSAPGVGVGAELGVHAEWRAWRFELDAVWLPPRRGTSAIDAEVGGSIRLVALGARVCALAVRAAITGGLCAALEAGQLHAEAFGADSNRNGNVRWISPGLGLSGRLRLAPQLGLLARVEGLVPLDRSEFIVENVGQVHRPSLLVGRLAFGVDLDF